MADQYDDDDYDFAEDNGPANLRKALKKAEKRNKELEDMVSSLKSTNRDRSVKDVLDAKGVNPKIASFIPKDMETPEQIATWLEEYSDVFGFQVQQSNAPEITEDVRSSQRIDNAISNAVSPTYGDDIANQLANVSSKEELDRLIFGGSTGR